MRSKSTPSVEVLAESPGISEDPIGTSANPMFEVVQEDDPESDPKKTPVNIESKTPLKHCFKVFTLWRPSTNCPRCNEEYVSSSAVRTTQYSNRDAVIVCPHTDKLEYERIITQSINGTVLLVFKEFLSDPSTFIRYAHVEWAVVDEDAVKEDERKTLNKLKDQVWPPTRIHSDHITQKK